jgi:uncharacterized membrane protein
VPAAVRATLPKDARKLSFAVAPDIPPVMPNVAAVVPQVAMVGAQIFLVAPNIAPLLAGGSIVAVADIAARLATVLSGVPPVAANVAPVLPAVNTVLMKVAPVLSKIWVLSKNNCRSQQSKHQQRNDSSSHISPLSPPGLSGLWGYKHGGRRKVLGVW